MFTVLSFLFSLTFSIGSSKHHLVNVKNNACKHLADYHIKDISPNCYENPDVGAPTPEIIRRHGYMVEAYPLVTPDGYILTIYRIPPKEDDMRKKKQPIFLEHGILVDSAAWILVGNRSVAFSLADDGYDVWLGNQRGTRYSREHLTLKPTEQEFWNYNLDTVAANDISASLKKVAEITEMPGSIVYVGHSRGTSLMFMYASEFPEEAQQLLRGFVALAPIVYFDPHLYVKIAIALAPLLGKTIEKLGLYALFEHAEPIDKFLQFACPRLPFVCRFAVTAFSGRAAQFQSEDLVNFFSHFPTPIALNQLRQYGQMRNSDKFQKFDYGKIKNLEIYGQKEPPLYDLGKINIPVFMFFGKNDLLISEKNVKRIHKELGSKTKKYFSVPKGNKIKRNQFNHNDYYFAKHLTKFFYKDLAKVLKFELKV